MVESNVQDCRSHGGRIENRRLRLGVVGLGDATREVLERDKGPAVGGRKQVQEETAFLEWMNRRKEGKPGEKRNSRQRPRAMPVAI